MFLVLYVPRFILGYSFVMIVAVLLLVLSSLLFASMYVADLLLFVYVYAPLFYYVLGIVSSL